MPSVIVSGVTCNAPVFRVTAVTQAGVGPSGASLPVVCPEPPDPGGYVCRATEGTYNCEYCLLCQVNGNTVYRTRAECVAACTPGPMGWVRTTISDSWTSPKWYARGYLTAIDAGNNPDGAIDYADVTVPELVRGLVPSLPANHVVIASQRRTWGRGTFAELGSCVSQNQTVVTVPSGVATPVQVTVYGSFDDTFGVNGQPPIGGCSAAAGLDYSTTFVLTSRSFSIEWYDTLGRNCGGTALIAYSRYVNPAP